MNYRRRQFLEVLGRSAAFGAAFALPRLGRGQDGPTATALTDKITLLTGAGNNVLVLKGNNGSLLVDDGDAQHIQEVMRMAGPVATVFNTHWHPNSTGGNDALAKSGAKIISHVNTQLWMTQEITHDWENDKVYPPRAKEALPTETFYKDGKLEFAGETIAYGLLPLAHTDGDIYVHFTKSNVLAVGDTVQVGRLPDLDWFTGGWLTGMITAHRTILGIADDTTKIVPASGGVLTKAQVQANMELLTKVRDHLVTLIKQGKGPQNLIDAKAMQDFTDLAGDPAKFLYVAYRGLWLHARELGGVV